ncbi:HipA domain-containing protein [Candidatus Zixiibacteriota bacterium]
MNRCLITYDDCSSGRYSRKGLNKLSSRLGRLKEFPLSAAEQRREALRRADKISIQGVQPKLSARLSIADEGFELVDTGGRFILKPQHADYPELPENEDLSMRLAAAAGIETPLHGLLHSADSSLTYFIRRFDRKSQKDKLAVQDFATLADRDRETKYRFSVERLFDLLEYCTFPAIETAELFKRLLFNYLIGNEDMHLKNWALITADGKTTLAPAYDLLSTTIAFRAIDIPQTDIEESALPLQGRKKKLTRSNWIDYLAGERLQLSDQYIERVLGELSDALPSWRGLIDRSFLSEKQQALYHEVLEHRSMILLG